MPPSEALQPSSSPGARRFHLEAKYREGKYRRYHPLFGNQEELDKVSTPSPWDSCAFLTLPCRGPLNPIPFFLGPRSSVSTHLSRQLRGL